MLLTCRDASATMNRSSNQPTPAPRVVGEPTHAREAVCRTDLICRNPTFTAPVMPGVPRLTFHAFRRPSVVRNPSDTPLTIHDSIATGRRPRTIYHFTSVVAVVAWI